MESGLMMTIEQLRNKLKSIDDSFEVEEIKETHVEFTKMFIAHQKNAGDIEIELGGEVFMTLTNQYENPSIIIDGAIIENQVISGMQKALGVVSNFLRNGGNNDD